MIDPSLLKYLPAEKQTDLRELEKTLTSDGFNILMQFWTERFNHLTQAALAATTWEDNRLATGAREAFAEVLRIEDAVTNEFSALANEYAVRREEEELEEALEYE